MFYILFLATDMYKYIDLYKYSSGYNTGQSNEGKKL